MADYDDFDGYSEYDEYDTSVDPEDIGEAVPPWRPIVDFPPYFIDRTIFWHGADGTIDHHDVPLLRDIPPPPAYYEQGNLPPGEIPHPTSAIPSSSITIPLRDLEFGAPRQPRCTDLREWLFHNGKANLVPVDLSGLAAVTLVSSSDTPLDNGQPASISPSSKIKYESNVKLVLTKSPEVHSITSMSFVKLDHDGNVTRLDRVPRRLDFTEPLSDGEMVRYEFMFRSAQQACRELATQLHDWLENLCQLRDVYEGLSRDTKETLKLNSTLMELHGYTQEQPNDVSPRLMEWFASSPIGCLHMYINKVLGWIARLPSRTRSIGNEIERITNIPPKDFTTAGDYLQDLARKMIGLTIVVKSGWYGVNDVEARVKHFREHTRAERVSDELPDEDKDSLPELVEAVSETRI